MSEVKRLLIIDDEADIRLLLKKFFSKKGFEVSVHEDGTKGLAFLKQQSVDLVLCDFRLPDYLGLEMLQKIKIIDPAVPVIIITGYTDVRVAVEALKKGAFDYVTKPLYPDEILHTVQNALGKPASPKVPAKPKEKKATTERAEFVMGPSRQSQTVQQHIDLIAPTDMSVIIQGETGTGKEYVARAVHARSQRAEKAFVAVDCGALPKELAGSELFGHVKGAFTGALEDRKGCFELANGGTLFLDEIGNLSYDNQVKLLRVLQERVVKRVGGTKSINVDVRVIVATNEDLKEAVREGDFREDIYHRLNEFRIELAPLRERKEDIGLFADQFLLEANSQLGKTVKGFTPGAKSKLASYYWHGNLRELKNVVKRATLLCPDAEIDEAALPTEITEARASDSLDMEVSFNGRIPGSLKEVAEEAEKQAILDVLARTNNNKTKTAQILKVDRKTLYNKLKTFGIEV